MDHCTESRITECAAYVRVDFGSCDYLELCATYRSFADLCLGKQVNGALLTAGDNSPEGHRQLRETFAAMARGVAIAPDFKLALVASSPAVQAIYREVQHALRAAGLNAWVFDTVPEAIEWLEGLCASAYRRAVCEGLH